VSIFPSRRSHRVVLPGPSTWTWLAKRMVRESRRALGIDAPRKEQKTSDSTAWSSPVTLNVRSFTMASRLTRSEQAQHAQWARFPWTSAFEIVYRLLAHAALDDTVFSCLGFERLQSGTPLLEFLDSPRRAERGCFRLTK